MINTASSSFPLILTGDSSALFSENNMYTENTHVFSGTFAGAQTSYIYLYHSSIEQNKTKKKTYILIIEMPITTATWNIGDAVCNTRVIRTEKFMRILLPTMHNTDIKNILTTYNKNNTNTTRNAINTLIYNICAPLFDSGIQLLRQCIEHVHYTTWRNIYTAHEKYGDQFMSMSTQRNNNILVPNPKDSTQYIPIFLYHLYLWPNIHLLVDIH